MKIIVCCSSKIIKLDMESKLDLVQEKLHSLKLPFQVSEYCQTSHLWVNRIKRKTGATLVCRRNLLPTLCRLPSAFKKVVADG